jgi:uncharacterized protein (DUF305 family)
MKLFLAAIAVLGACGPMSEPSGIEPPDSSSRPDTRPDTRPGAPDEPVPEMEIGTESEASLSYDAQFIDAMIAYANHSKNLAEIGARRAQKDELRVFSKNLAADQTARIAELQNWRELWYDTGRARMPTLDQAALNLGMPRYEYGAAWEIDAAELDPQHPEAMQGVTKETGAAQWDANEQLAALKNLPDDAFDAFFTAALVQHDIWGMQVAHASLPQLEHPEIQTVGQEIVTDNLIHVNQLARWRNDWFGAQTEGMGPEEPGTR